MLQVRSLLLPKNFPTDKAIKSFGQNIHNYEPEFWEFQYENYRYLKNISDQKLIKRYEDLCRNFTVFSDNDRDKIPINSYQSSWYWYRKEHQTRYEFFLRKLSLPEPPKPRSVIKKPYRNEKPVSHDILYRYGYNKSITSLFEFGYTKIKPASVYKDGISSDPRTDDEKNKERWFVGDHSKITTLNGDEIKTIGDVKSNNSACDYYVLCLSYDFEPLMFEEFGYDSCLIIKNPEEFAFRLEAEFKKHFPGWYFHHNPIHYFDPFEHQKNEYFSPTMSKDFSFAYQMEYRFLLDPLKPTEEIKSLSEFEIQLGSLSDICELYRV
jgi:hypothetical protein